MADIPLMPIVERERERETNTGTGDLPIKKIVTTLVSTVLLSIVVTVLTVKYYPHEEVDGAWGEWSDFSQCSKTCLSKKDNKMGVTVRTRQCTPTQKGGNDCGGIAKESIACAHGPGDNGNVARWCEGAFEEWSAWTPCDRNCGGGHKKRQRYCQEVKCMMDEEGKNGDVDEQTCNSDPCPGCPAGWKEYQTKCYKRFDALRNWQQAEMACKKCEGHLASINSKGHSTFIKNLVVHEAYVGGFKIDNWGLWADGSTWNYTNWFPGEPSGDGNCMNMFINDIDWNIDWNDRWNDRDCEYKSQYICEIFVGKKSKNCEDL